jgi:flagellar hook-associated protein 3 FlgL
MLNRVTNLTMSAAAQRTLQTQQSRLAELQEKATTLNKISRPSDDPAATAQALQTRARLASAAQYALNIQDGDRWLAAADSALEQATNVVHKMQDLAVQAGNDTLSASGREALARELESLNEDLLSIANRKHLGRNIFAGSSDAPNAFAGTPAAFKGVPDSSVERRVSESQTIRVDADGAAIFGVGPMSIFDTVKGIVTALRGDQDITALAGQLESGVTSVIDGRAEIGVRQAQLERAGNINTELEATLDAQRNGIEKADLGSAIMDLKLQETNYQVALAATARVLQPTLMDFLR